MSYTSSTTPTLFTVSNVACIAYNTKIKMHDNTEKNIQDLKLGDVVKTLTTPKKIIYIGYSTSYNYKKHFRCIKKNTIKENIPNKDLYLSNGHSIFFDNNDHKEEYFVARNTYKEFYDKAKKFENYKRLLVEDFTKAIEIEDKNEEIYFHIVLENEDKDDHYIIYANNMMVESMCENYIINSKLEEYKNHST